MNLPNEEEKRSQFREILFSLASSQEILRSDEKRQEVYDKLEKLYYIDKETRFRHYYSDIFSVLTQIKSSEEMGDIDTIGQNLSILRDNYSSTNKDENGEPINIDDSIKKLYDHISLDIARICYTDKLDKVISSENAIRELSAKTKEIEDCQARTKLSLDTMQLELKQSAKDYITILGIFASIVLALTAGISFASSVFENIHQASIYRIALISLFIGLVLVNSLYALFYYIDRLVHSSDERSIKPLTSINTIFLVLISLVVLAWIFGLVEFRNAFVS